MTNFKEELHKIKAFLFDVDGVFANANIYLTPEGEMMRTMNTKDGFAVVQALKQGFLIGIITGGYSESVRIRFNDLGVKDIYLKSPDKYADYQDFITKYNLKSEDIMYMGDDLPDYKVMNEIGLAVCPADAVEEIKSISAYISDKEGGQGCVRDVIEQVMRAQAKWNKGI